MIRSERIDCTGFDTLPHFFEVCLSAQCRGAFGDGTEAADILVG